MDFTGLEGIAILIHIGDSAHVQHFQFSLNPLCAFQILCPYYSCKKKFSVLFAAKIIT